MAANIQADMIEQKKKEGLKKISEDASGIVAI